MKQGEEYTKFVKEEDNNTSKYIFQWNAKTRAATIFILIVLVLIIIAITLSGNQLQL